jgi:hypothetical protein
VGVTRYVWVKAITVTALLSGVVYHSQENLPERDGDSYVGDEKRGAALARLKSATHWPQPARTHLPLQEETHPDRRRYKRKLLPLPE